MIIFRSLFAEAYSVSCAAKTLLFAGSVKVVQNNVCLELKGLQEQVFNSSFFLVVLDWN